MSLISAVKAILGAKDLAQHQLGHLTAVLVELKEDDYDGCWAVIKNFGSVKDVMPQAEKGLEAMGIPPALTEGAIDVVAPVILKLLDNAIPEEQILAVIEPLLKL